MINTSTPSPTASKPRRRKSRRAFGTVRQLPSGRWQARWEDKHARTHSGPHTFDTERAADDWLSTVRADLVRGVWRSPDLGSDTLAAYMRAWVDQRTDLAVSTRASYHVALARWIERDLTVSGPHARRSIAINIGEQPLNTLTPARCGHAISARERRPGSRAGRSSGCLCREPFHRPTAAPVSVTAFA